ncbi:MAG: hypothetical protein ACREMG_09560 [Gemmatimonadales bacterium]
MRLLTIGAVLLVGLLSCGKEEANPRPDTLTRRQRDSMLGASQLPGAQGVRGALRAADSAAARRAREEAVTPEP